MTNEVNKSKNFILIKIDEKSKQKKGLRNKKYKSYEVENYVASDRYYLTKY